MATELTLRDLPQVRDRFAAGTVSYSKVRAITRVATPATQAMLLDWCDGAPAHVLERIVRDAERYGRTDDAPVDRDDLGTIRRWRADGTSELVVRVDGAAGLALEQHLDRLADVAAHGRGRPSTTDEDSDVASAEDDADRGAVVPRAVCEADAVLGALAAAVAAGPDDTCGLDRHLVVAHVDAADLAAAEHLAATAPARIGATGPTPTSPGTAPAEAPVGTPIALGAASAEAPAPAPTDPGRAVAAGPARAPADRSAASAEAPVRLDDLGTGSAGAPRGDARDADERPNAPSWTAGAGADHRGGADPPRPTTRVVVRDGRGRVRVLARAWLERLACTAGRVSVLDRGDGHPADLGRDARRPDARLRRAVRDRDRTCRVPGCAATRWLVVHHVAWWSDGGPTDLDNLVLLCGAHHRTIHDDGWTMRAAGRGRWTFHRPGDTTGGHPHPHTVGLAARSAADADPDTRQPPPSTDALRAAATAHAHDMAPDALQPQHWDGWYDHDDAVFVLMEQTHLATQFTTPRPERTAG